MKTFTYILVALSLVAFLTMPAAAEMSPDELAAETIAYVKSTAKDNPMLPSTVVAKVNEAHALLSAEGTAAYPKFKGKGSPFLYDGTYIWIHSLKDGTMLMHPIKYKMEGKNYIALKDKKGKRLFAAMNNLVAAQGEGWVDYYWPNPADNSIVRKVSFVKKCTLPDGTNVVIGSGIYKGNEAELAKLTIH